HHRGVHRADRAARRPRRPLARAEAMSLTEAEIGALIATLARAGGLAATAPVIGDPGSSLRARLVFVLAITAAVGLNRAPVALSALQLVAALELAVGLVTGLTAHIVLARVAIAG